ncbi:MAG: hypothetical protein ACOC5E_03535 [Acidobacteriota bacterium]
MRGRHPDPTEMVAYARGALDADDAAAVLEHCESCRDCGNQLAAVLLLRQSRESTAYPRRWIAAAAAAMLVVGLVTGVYWLQGSPGPGEDSLPGAPSIVEAPPGAEHEAATASYADLASREIPDWYFGTFEIVIERFGAVAADAGGPSLIAIFREAITAMKRGQYGRAVELLEPCCGGGRYHRWGTALLGAALLGEGEDLDRAAAELARVAELRSEGESEVEAWFLANLHLLQERPKPALRLLRDLHRDTRVGRMASALIPRIEERLRADAGTDGGPVSGPGSTEDR